MTNPQTSPLTFPMTLGSAVRAGREIPIIARSAAELVTSGPFLVEVLQEAYGLTRDDAHSAAELVEQVLHAAWSSSNHGQPLADWMADLPAPILVGLLDLASTSSDDYFAVAQSLRLSRLVLGELATALDRR